MDLKRISLTELGKEPLSNTTGLGKSYSLGVLDPINKRLVAELNSRFKPSMGINKKFITPGNIFEEALAEYCKVRDDPSFMAFTKKVMTLLENIIRKVCFAKGGYIVIADYDSYVGVFMIRHKEEMFFVIKSNTISTLKIDHGKMAKACRIDIGRYEKEEGQYLSFVSDGNESISQYFFNWFSVQ